ncbi:DNA topoisomerase III [Clostridium botulinum C]|uniref:DNA topoisomerase 3 n=2 Tax=Clostridium botulinum TaxID=1491 RepID=A0A9Q4XW74_CLOBO|nr:DNA topoisomerase III [Clostridium botulinum]EGO88480.2 DNA topoisomerase III [Clostridium botulinum C str. Stockholm]MCD3195631.1 DNA topoisomerase III [Clostridium botulinum C]MCD3201046.1 DNA topoisomerase III [Clostridium botulinum C]MCD3379183.1 DNA topoisomerase III [Clostridium botulinum C]NFD88299.1 DNA topoisomerase III [Clostridium botulinum]
MSKILVLAEKPSVGRDIARVLNCRKGGNGYLEGEKYIVTWALGHLVTLADPEVYDNKYKTWDIEDLPMIPKHLKLVVIKKSGKQFNVVKSQMNRDDVNEIVIATDAGREGELVARWIIDKAHIKKPIKRLWISSVTDKAIKDGFKNLKDGREYNNLYKSAIARAEADWLVGINATRALTCKYNAQLSCGRVQTPTIAMIAEREEEIKNFKPKTYYGIEAKADKLKLVWQDGKSKDIKTFNKDKCENIFIKIKNKDAEVIEVNKVKKKKFSPQLYDLTELQRDANKIFNFSAKETLSIMQRLYENHKVLTYPRTDSRYITVDVVETLKDRLKACGVGEYSKFTNRLLRANIKGNKGFVDNSKVSDHHAIIPTEQKFVLSSLSDSERKIYDLVVKRFLAVLYPPFEYEQTTIKAKIGEEYFIAKGKIVLSQGWKEVYSNVFEEDDLEGELKEQILPSINKGDTLKINSISKTKGETKPPKPFNEGTLLSAMENPVKYMREESKELKKTIGETGGIGTVATRADIIEKLFNTFLIEKRGKDIFITSKGKQLLELVPEELKSPALTAEWEQKLIAISKGKLNKDKFLNEIKDYSKDTVDEIKNSKEKFKHDNITRIKCPECGKYMLEVNGKKGKMLVCQDRDCGYRKGISRISNARCPECHKKLELRGEGEGQIFVCKCGYREKLSSFKERKKKDNNKLSKKEVNKYLKQQQKQQNEEPFNNAFAEAFAKLGLK